MKKSLASFAYEGSVLSLTKVAAVMVADILFFRPILLFFHPNPIIFSPNPVKLFSAHIQNNITPEQ
jgi:hypothetical protein